MKTIAPADAEAKEEAEGDDDEDEDDEEEDGANTADNTSKASNMQYSWTCGCVQNIRMQEKYMWSNR